eukprot:1053532-Pleurochrysis_carterae.AAC.3
MLTISTRTSLPAPTTMLTGMPFPVAFTTTAPVPFTATAPVLTLAGTLTPTQGCQHRVAGSALEATLKPDSLL